MDMYTECALKERYGKAEYTEYILENINRARIFLEFAYFWGSKEVKSEMVEVRNENIKNIFRNVADYNLRNYFNLFSLLNLGYLLVLDRYSESQEIKIIKNKKSGGEIEAIFRINASIFYDNPYSDPYFKVIINGILISKDFLIKIMENARNSHKINNRNIESIEKFTIFLKESHSKFFLLPFGFEDRYSLILRVFHYSNLSIKFTFKEWRMADICEIDNSFVDEIKFAKEVEYSELKLKNVMDIINIGKDETERGEDARKLICDIFIYLLLYYISDDELPKLKKTRLEKYRLSARIPYTWLKNKAKESYLLVSFLKLLETIVNVPRKYKNEDVFGGDLTLITMEIWRYDLDSIFLNVYCSIKSSYSENKESDKFLQIEMQTQTYLDYVDISITLFRDSFDNYIYMKKENLDIFINDFGKFLTKLGLFSHPNEFSFLARYAAVIQMLMP